ncbi:hypothetical protein OG512_30390 [Streptomyces sp. NBC_01378]|uniref:DUF6932 family protein n=1 Tax=Streptomyces sp. NBC_01378 TaxID=2903844 RepID=UPI003248B9E3
MELRFETDGHLHPGRYQVDLDDAQAFLVSAPIFAESVTRPGLWEGLERYLVRFWSLDERYAEPLGSLALVDRLWLGGSFVSSRVNPANIDVTVFIDHDAEKVVRNREGARWLTDAFQRDAVKDEFGLSPLRVRYVKVPSPFKTKELTQDDRHYYGDRGAWDDWWQRRRASDQVKDGPTVETAAARRGYLEVTL